MSSRIEEIKAIIQTTPQEPFPRYALAMEYKNLGFPEQAHQAFVELERLFPHYVPQYLMHGNLLMEIQQREDARRVFEQGLMEAEKSKNHHARSELAQALNQIEEWED